MTDPMFIFNDEEWVDPELRVHFASEKTAAALSALAERYSLDAVGTERMKQVVRQVAVGQVSDEDLADALEAAGIGFDAAIELQGDLWVEVLRQVAPLLEVQYGVYQDLHGEEFLPPPPPAAEDAHLVAARAVIAKAGAAPADPVLARRLESVAAAHLKDVRDDAETKAMLEKPIKTGGMGLAPEAADALVLALAAAKSGVGAVQEQGETQRAERAELEKRAKERRESKLAELRSKFAGAARTPVTTVVVPQTESSVPNKSESVREDAADAAEIQVFARAASIDAPAAEAAAMTVEDAVAEAVTASGVVPTDPDLVRRFHTLVTLYFRDLRDLLETKSKLTMPVTSGGMGMDDAAADAAMNAIADKRSVFHEAPAARAAEQKTQFVAAQADKHLTGTERAGEREQQDLERAYASLMNKAGLAAPVAAPAPQAEPRVIPVVAAPRDGAVPVTAPAVPPVPPPVIPVPMPKPVMRAPAAEAPAPAIPPPPPPPPIAIPKPPAPVFEPPANLPVAPPPNLPVAPLENILPPLPPPPPPAPKPVVVPPNPPAPPPAPPLVAPPAPKPTVAPRPLPPPAPSTPVMQVVKPVMTDVQSVPKLTGPVDELRQLNLEDFRRLSRDPKEATLKIKDKIDLLEEMGYENRTLGVKAFVESAINRLYLDVLRAGLEGTPVPDVIAALEARGAKTVTKPEFDALMELNRKLRFG